MRPMTPVNNQRGATLLIVLFMAVVVGLGAGVAGTTWQTVVQRAREEELFYRGDQYRRAIGSYFQGNDVGQTNTYPTRLEELLKDPRAIHKVRHLRKLYSDPLTGQDWEVIRNSTGKIIGVHSASDKTPFKKEGFAEHYKEFAQAKSYADWHFIYAPETEKRDQNTPATAPGTQPFQTQSLSPATAPLFTPPSPEKR
ncbi:MAG: type II secretion system protein [Desulfuromonadaceae bacterium]|nr:type II secretion system protein [Desulfuromonadaceae bacterium]